MKKSIILIFMALIMSSCSSLITRNDIKKCEEICGCREKISHLEKKDNQLNCECKKEN